VLLTARYPEGEHLLKKLGIITVVLVSLLGLGLFAASCGQQSASSTPKQVVQSWLNDLKNGNWSPSYDALTAADQKKITRKQWIDEYTKQGKPPADVMFTVSGEKITGNKATVSVKISQGGQNQNGSITLLKEGNAWKVSASTSSQAQ
jgi:hypothetical protein